MSFPAFVAWLAVACSSEESPGGAAGSAGGVGGGSAGTSAGVGGTGGTGGHAGSAGTAAGSGASGGSAGHAGSGGEGGTSGSGGAGGGGAAGGTAGTGGGGGQGGTSGGAGGTGGEGARLPDFCPSDPSGLVPSLDGSVEQVDGVPPDDDFAPGWAILEGPVWYEGALYLSEVVNEEAPPNARILKYTPGGAAEPFIQPSGSNGLALTADGRFLAAQHKPSGAIVRFDPTAPDSPAELVVGSFEGAPFNSPNDIAVREDGHFYFTDPNWQAPTPPPQAEERAYWVPPGGVISPIAGAPEKPNGVSLAPGGNLLYVAGTGALSVFPLAADGSVGAGAPFGERAYTEIDGMAVDCAGNLYLADNGGGQVFVVSAAGVELGALPGVPGVTNLAFGGAERSLLYITTLGDRPALFQVDVGVPGLPY